MKKFFALLLVLGVLLVHPLDAFAASSVSLPKKVTGTDNGDGTFTYVYPITISNIEESENFDFKEISIEFSHGTAITKFTCEAASEFTVTQSGTSPIDCVFSAKEDSVSGKSFKVGQVVVVATKDAPEEQCKIEYRYKGATGIVTTGISFPYVVVIGGIAIATGLFLAAKKKTKLQRI